MAWYWWILIGILGLNGLVVVLVGIFLLRDHIRSRREAISGRGASPGEGDES
jgi:hypothetical protein